MCFLPGLFAFFTRRQPQPQPSTPEPNQPQMPLHTSTLFNGVGTIIINGGSFTTIQNVIGIYPCSSSYSFRWILAIDQGTPGSTKEGVSSTDGTRAGEERRHGATRIPCGTRMQVRAYVLCVPRKFSPSARTWCSQFEKIFPKGTPKTARQRQKLQIIYVKWWLIHIIPGNLFICRAT